MKLKILMPAASVITAGSISYPYLFNGSSSGVSSSDSLSLNLSDPTFNNSRSLPDINSGRASSLSVSPLDSSKNPSLEIQSDSPGINLDTKGEIMQTNTLPVVNLQKELDKESKVGDLTEEQMRELKEAIEYINRFQQGFKVIVAKVQEYNKLSSNRGQNFLIRTFKEIRDQSLSSHHRKSLQKFFEAYWKLKNYSFTASVSLDKILDDSSKFSKSNHPKAIQLRKVKDALNQIGWKEKEVKLFAQMTNNDNWGWGSWEQNPFSVFMKNEGDWRKKMIRIQDAESIYKLNKDSRFECSAYYVSDLERADAIKEWCEMDNMRFEQLIEGYRSEIELDIASWLLDQMQIILKEREATR